MSYELIFTLLNIAVMPAWLLLIFLPRAEITRTLVHSAVYPFGIGLFYIVVMALHVFFGYATEGGNFTSIPGISAVFQHPNGVLIAWSHILLFDLFVGAWIGRDSQRRGLHHWAVVPCLLLTYLLGPIGLVAYLAVRLITGRGGLALSQVIDDRAMIGR